MIDKAILWAMIAALCYGFGSPFWKAATTNGASTAGIILVYGLSGFAICWLTGQTTLFGSPKGFIYAGTCGILFGMALFACGKAVSMPTGYISLISAIVASYPLISTATSLVFLGEAKNFNLVPLLIGSVLTVTGLIIITNSVKGGVH